MKKTWMIRILLFAGYCVPFAYLSVNGDAASEMMLYYVVMIAGFTLLCWGALETNNTNIVFIGNLLSFASSYITAKLSGLEPMGYYFKPLTSYSLIVCISVVAMIVQAVIVRIYTLKKNRRNNMVLDRKKITPVTYFSGSMILKAIAYQDNLLSLISSLLILGSAIFMGIRILQEAPSKERTKHALAECAFCLIMWGIVYFLTPHIGNVLVCVICLMITYYYIKKCPRFYIQKNN